MLINSNKRIYKISEKLISADIEIIKLYILSSVNAVCKVKQSKNSNKTNARFSVSSLFGGNNRNWAGTPLQKIYDYYKSIGKTHDVAYKQAAQDMGKLLARVLADDKREFIVEYQGRVKSYRMA